ncbi:MAG TPA: hypothetical protein VGR50_03680 [Terriglobales bacterium]|nr:hypothetical protein [Terriglobales bacterium]
MATAAPTKLSPSAITHDRKFYCGVALAMALTVLVGFAPSFYLRGIFHKPTPSGMTTLATLTVIHGTLFTTWVLFFILQTTLIARHRVALHRKMGIAGALLAAAMIVAGTAMAISMARRGGAPPGVDPLAFMAVPLGDIFMFTVFVGSALWLRRNKEAHKRLMVLAYISILAAAVARLPGVLAHGPFAFYGLTMIFLVMAAIYDFLSRRRVHAAYVWGGTALVLSVPGRLLLSATPLWHAFAQALVRR